jgi:uncharacterized RDD family membrane protein YckC
MNTIESNLAFGIADQHVERASRRRRIFAFLIDHVSIVFLMVAIIFLRIGSQDMPERDLFSTMLPVMSVGFLFYFAKDSINGVSLGKGIMGIAVCDEKNPELTPSFIRMFARNLLLVIWPVEFVVLIISDDKRRLGDRITGCVVLKDSNPSGRTVRVLALVSLLVLCFIATFFGGASMMKNSDAYKAAIHNIESDQQIIEYTGGITGYGWLPTGNIHISGETGTADLEIKISGKSRDLRVSVNLEKDSLQGWRVTELRRLDR